MNHEHLEKKGWSKEELSHAHNIFVKANSEKPHSTHKHWLITTIGVLGVIIFALYLTPLVLLLPALGAYPVAFLVGIIFSYMLTQAYRSFHHTHHNIKNHHHISAQTMLSITAVASLMFLITLANNTADLPVIFSQVHNPLLIGIIFALGVFLPYRLYHEEHKKTLKRIHKQG